MNLFFQLIHTLSNFHSHYIYDTFNDPYPFLFPFTIRSYDPYPFKLHLRYIQWSIFFPISIYNTFIWSIPFSYYIYDTFNDPYPFLFPFTIHSYDPYPFLFPFTIHSYIVLYPFLFPWQYIHMFYTLPCFHLQYIHMF